MISLGVIVFAEVFQGVAQRCFPKQNEMGKTFALDRAHPALREGIQIWAARRKSQALHTFGCQGLSEVSAELGIAVVQHIAMAVQISDSSSTALRAICVIHSSVGCRVMPAKLTRRVSRCRKNRTKYVTRPSHV